jgi:methylglutaconyl-CoA hydratase
MKNDVLRVERAGKILVLRLNRPEKRNALNGPLVEALDAALQAAEGDEELRGVLLRGEGPDFCAGADLSELKATTAKGPEASLAEARRLGALFLRMRRHPRPIVAAVHGKVLAGGCGLATACDLVLSHEEAQFGYPEVHLGFVPAMVMAILRRKLTEGTAFELVTLGNRISATEALRIGLVNRVFPKNSFERDVEGFVSELASRPKEAISLTKGLLYELAEMSFEEGIERGAEVNVQARETEECRAGVKAFLRKRRPPSP